MSETDTSVRSLVDHYERNMRRTKKRQGILVESKKRPKAPRTQTQQNRYDGANANAENSSMSLSPEHANKKKNEKKPFKSAFADMYKKGIRRTERPEPRKQMLERQRAQRQEKTDKNRANMERERTNKLRKECPKEMETLKKLKIQLEAQKRQNDSAINEKLNASMALDECRDKLAIRKRQLAERKLAAESRRNERAKKAKDPQACSQVLKEIERQKQRLLKLKLEHRATLSAKNAIAKQQTKCADDTIKVTTELSMYTNNNNNSIGISNANT